MKSLPARYVLPTLIVIYSLDFMDRSILAMVGESLRLEMGFSDAQLGVLHSVLLLALIALVLPCSILNDVFGRRKVLAGAACIWSAAMLGTGLARSFPWLVGARLAGSVNDACTGTGGTAWLSLIHPPQTRGRILGWFQMSAPLGMALGTLAGGVLLSLTGSWRVPFLILAPLGLASAWVISRLPDSQPKWEAGYVQGLLPLFRSHALLLTGCAAGMYCLLKYAYQSWLPALLLRHYEVSDYQAGLLAAAMLLAGAAGPFLGGVFSDYWAARSPSGRFKAAALSVLLLVLIKFVFYNLVGVLPLPALFLLGLVDGVFTMLPIPMYFSIVQDMVEDRYRSAATGLMATLAILTGGAWGPLLVGTLSDFFGGGAMGLQKALLALLLCGLLSALLFLLAKLFDNTGSRSPDKQAGQA